MKKPNEHLNHIVRSLNLFTDGIEKAYRIEHDNAGFYIKRIFNDKYTLTIRSDWSFYTSINIILFRYGTHIDRVQLKIRATDAYKIHHIIQDLEKLVAMNWDGSYRDQVNDLKHGELCWYNQ
ncbi:hypothetical protein [Neobacillus vireti]|uniref:DUF1257 domain-containing protein n=1 Tax=Neobacillus vireti LMG 21834 TaxID=1131730 RepID=A0AB94IJQ4_9BACI|nr:hypothetical protein [Neobacillus vireti]ETI67265.1 hypothetical protein BAVI_18487 [Neobacillus vireti LMG 21834]KLT19660.1 hypothetical protein AA980_03455 [Neobacillus vireti]